MLSRGDFRDLVRSPTLIGISVGGGIIAAYSLAGVSNVALAKVVLIVTWAVFIVEVYSAGWLNYFKLYRPCIVLLLASISGMGCVYVATDISIRKEALEAMLTPWPVIPAPNPPFELSPKAGETENAERLKIEKEQLALNFVPSAAVIYEEHQIRVYNNGKTNIESWGFQYGKGAAQPSNESRLLVPGTYYYYPTETIEQQMRDHSDNEQLSVPCYAFIVTQDSKKYTIKCQLIASFATGTLSFRTQTLETVEGWKTDNP